MGYNPNEPRDESGKWAAIPGYIKQKIDVVEGMDLKAAEKYAIEKGLAKSVDYSGLSATSANTFNQQLLHLKEKFNLPALTEIKAVDSIGDQMHSFAAFKWSAYDSEKSIEINRKVMKEIDEVGEDKFFEKYSGLLESKNVRGIAHHEGMHFVERSNFSKMDGLEKIREAFNASKGIENGASKYSTLSSREFFAELGTAKMNGKELHELYTVNKYTIEEIKKIQALWDLL